MLQIKVLVKDIHKLIEGVHCWRSNIDIVSAMITKYSVTSYITPQTLQKTKK